MRSPARIRLMGLATITLAVVGLALPAMSASPADIVLDGRDGGGIFEGIGAVSAGASSRLLIDYPEPQRRQILDLLFKPGVGAALQHLKVEIGGDANSTDGAEPSHMRSSTEQDYTRGYEWWLMREARKRNPRIILDALPWTAPGWIGSNSLYSSAMVDYVVDFLRGAKAVHGLAIDYVGIWNERPYDGTYVKDLARALRNAKLGTKIVCCDAYGALRPGPYAILDPMRDDPELREAIAAIGIHYPLEPTAPAQTPQAALGSGKPLWSSEDQPNPGSGPYLDRTWALGGRVLAKQYIANYLDKHLTKTEIWSPVTAYYDTLAAPHSGLMYANTPWSGHYEIQSTIWVTAHTTQFTQPGWHYLDHGSGHLGDQASYVALAAPDRSAWTIVFETVDAHQPVTRAFRLEGGLAASQVLVWETNAKRTFERVAVIPVHDGAFNFTFEPDALYTLTTTKGQARGDHDIPPKRPFPFPYVETFEMAPLHRSPRYLADQDGAFEVEPCMDRQGRCLVQQITRPPVPWAQLGQPYTLAGDAGWRDYALSVDVRPPRYGKARLFGRIDSADAFASPTSRLPSGYALEVGGDGQWRLISTLFKTGDRILADGSVGSLADAWHHIRLRFRRDHISASVDGRQLFEVIDTDHAAGQIGLGGSWQRIAFDNLLVATD